MTFREGLCVLPVLTIFVAASALAEAQPATDNEPNSPSIKATISKPEEGSAREQTEPGDYRASANAVVLANASTSVPSSSDELPRPNACQRLHILDRVEPALVQIDPIIRPSSLD